jgi:hypothetical protein
MKKFSTGCNGDIFRSIVVQHKVPLQPVELFFVLSTEGNLSYSKVCYTIGTMERDYGEGVWRDSMESERRKKQAHPTVSGQVQLQ